MNASNESRIRRLIQRHSLARIELSTTGNRGYHAVAYPAPWSPVVAERRAAAYAADGKSSFSIAEATEIADKAAHDALCRAHGDDIEHAIEALAGELDALPPAA